MQMLPKFNTPEDRREFDGQFNVKLLHYMTLAGLVRDSLYGDRYEWDRLTGDTLRQIFSVTDNLCYETMTDFKKDHPEYKSKYELAELAED